MPVEVVIANERESIQRFYKEWSQLAQQCGHSFATYPFWCQAKLGITEDLEKVVLVLVYDQQQLQAVLPFERKTLSRAGLAIDYLELFYANEMGICDIASTVPLPSLWPAICQALRQKGIPCQFVKCQHYLSGSNVDQSQLASVAGFTKVSHQSSSLVFPQGYTAFMEGYNTKFRRNLRRLTKKARGMGELHLECVCEPEQLERAFQHFLQVEDCGWKGEQGTSIQKQADALAYYRSLLAGFAEVGACQINLLMLDQQCIAAQFCVRVEKTLYLLKIGYDENYGAISPGQILIDRLVEYGAESQTFDEVSFVTGYGWMDRWSPTLKPVFLSYLPTGHILGRVLIALLKIRERFKR